MAGHDAGGHDHLRHLGTKATPAVFAARAEVVFAPPARADQVEVAVSRFFAALSGGLADAGCTLVGHVKGTLAAPGHGDLAFHATALAEPPLLTGGIAGDAQETVLTVNVIVFGVPDGDLPGIVKEAWSRATGTQARWRQ